jgi:hypothetical protein
MERQTNHETSLVPNPHTARQTNRKQKNINLTSSPAADFSVNRPQSPSLSFPGCPNGRISSWRRLDEHHTPNPHGHITHRLSSTISVSGSPRSSNVSSYVPVSRMQGSKRVGDGRYVSVNVRRRGLARAIRSAPEVSDPSSGCLTRERERWRSRGKLRRDLANACCAYGWLMLVPENEEKEDLLIGTMVCPRM